MIETNAYKSDVELLEQYRDSARANSDTEEFYYYLFKYMQVLHDNKELFNAAWSFWHSKAVDKYKDNEEAIVEILSPLLKEEDKKLSAKEKLKKLSSEDLKPSTLQGLGIVQKINDQLDKGKYKEVDPSYAFYKLFFDYYSILTLDPEVFKKGVDMLNSDPDRVVELSRQKLGLSEEELQEILTAAKDTKTQKFFKEQLPELIEKHSSIVPVERSLQLIAEYKRSLNFFHTEFTHWLKNNKDIGAISGNENAQEIVYVGNAKIYYKDYMTYIELPYEKGLLKLRTLKITPNSGYDHFLKYMFEPKHEDELISSKKVQDIHIKCEGYSDVGETLRHCGFNKTLKKVFMAQRMDSAGFIYRKEAPVTQAQVDDIKKFKKAKNVNEQTVTKP